MKEASATPAMPEYPTLQDKADAIRMILLQPQVDLWRLREFALSKGGLVNDTIRKQAWPKLVGVVVSPTETQSPEESNAPSHYATPEKDDSLPDTVMVIPPSPEGSPRQGISVAQHSMDVEQIERDVARCTWHLMTGANRPSPLSPSAQSWQAGLTWKQRQLAQLINSTLVQSYQTVTNEQERLRYFQGYHDVASIFLQALGDSEQSQLPSRTLLQVSQSHFRDHMRSSFASLQTALRVALYPLLAQLDGAVHDHLQACEMEPYFLLSWVLTWFAHDVRDTELVQRLFDAFLASHPLFPLYVAVAMMLHPTNRQILLNTECDFSAVHHCLSNLPRNSCRVGWRRSPVQPDGYISDDEDDENEFVLADDAVPTPLHEPLTTDDNLVSFEELIDMALDYMARFPPRCLVDLARHYNPQSDEDVSSSLLQDPPTWALVGKADADWVVQQRQVSDEEDSLATMETPVVDYEYLHLHSYDRAVVAAGYGPGPEEAARRRRRRKERRFVMGVVTVGLLAVGVGLALQNPKSSSGSSSSTVRILSTSALPTETKLATSEVLATKSPQSLVSANPILNTRSLPLAEAVATAESPRSLVPEMSIPQTDSGTAATHLHLPLTNAVPTSSQCLSTLPVPEWMCPVHEEESVGAVEAVVVVAAAPLVVVERFTARLFRLLARVLRPWHLFWNQHSTKVPVVLGSLQGWLRKK